MSRGPACLPTLTPAQRKVLADLSLFRNDDNVAEVSHSHLAETTGLTKSTIESVIRRLNALKLIVSRPGGGRRTSKHVVCIPVPELSGRVLSRLEKGDGRDERSL